MKEFKGKTAVITGAAHGFGLEFAKQCAQRGMNIVMNDFEGDALDAAVKEISGMGVTAIGVQGDMSVKEEVAKLVKTAVDKFGSVELMINNAGVYFTGNIWEMPARDVDWMIGINTLGLIYGMQEAIPQMIKQGNDCHILNVASIAGIVSVAKHTSYHASKHGALAASEATYQDLKKAAPNIGMTVFCPGYVQTDLHHSELRRPARFKATDAYYDSEVYKKNIAFVDKCITTGESIDIVGPHVFAAVENDQFYVKTPNTDSFFGDIIRERHQHIEDNTNP